MKVRSRLNHKSSSPTWSGPHTVHFMLWAELEDVNQGPDDSSCPFENDLVQKYGMTQVDSAIFPSDFRQPRKNVTNDSLTGFQQCLLTKS